MVTLRLAKFGALWATVAVLGARAYMQSQAAVTQDARTASLLSLVCLALIAGHALAWLAARRWPQRWSALGSDRLALSLLVASLCLSALSDTAPHTSIKVLRERIPPVLGWIYPCIAVATPLVVRASGHALSAATQALLLALAVVPLSGALVLMDGPTALGLGSCVLLMQLAEPGSRLRDELLLRLAGAVVALLTAAALSGQNPLQGMPSLSWILGTAAVGLAVAVRPRTREEALLLLTAPVACAVLVAVCGVLVTIELGQSVAWIPALRTRLVLFRQHPNFLAPFFAFHALLALGLALSSRKLRVPLLAAAALLALSTLHTASRAGIAGLLAGLLALALLVVAPRVRQRLPLRRLRVAALVVLLATAAGALFVAADAGRRAALADRAAGWLEKSLDYRLDAWRNSLQIVRDHPWLGVGPATFLSVERWKPGSRFFNELSAPHPHNAFLYVAQAAGLPALLLFLAWTLLLAWRLWRPPPQVDQTLPHVLRVALLAACAALLLANVLDLGMALDTVVPGPLFLLTGLVVAGSAPATRPRRPLVSLGWAVAVLALLFAFGLPRLWARVRFDQGLMLSALSDQRLGDDELMHDARWAMRRAIEHDRDLYSAYKLLASWTEAVNREAAEKLLWGLIARAPVYGPSHSLLGHLYLRAGQPALAADALKRSFADAQGGVFHTRDRAHAVGALAQVGRRDEALELLIEGLRLDVGILDALTWVADPATGRRVLPVGGSPPGEPIAMDAVVEALYARHLEDRAAGRPVGRRFWFDTYNAFRRAGDDERALAVLDDLEANVPDAEPHILAVERGHVARDRGRPAEARAFYEQAYALDNNPHFLTLAAEVGRELGESEGESEGGRELGESAVEGDDGAPPGPAAADEAATLVFQTSGEILDQPALYLLNLEAQAEDALERGELMAAADLLSRTLLYIDPFLQRAERWRRVGELYLSAGAHAAAETALRAALDEIGSRPTSLEQIRLGYLDTIPGRLARDLCAAWTGLGLDDAAQRRAAWALPHYSSARLVPALFRLAFLAETGHADALLREADLLLRHDKSHVFAMWAQLDAIEALGRYPELPAAMRSVLETLGRGALVDRYLKELELTMASRLDDPRAWTDGGVLTLLKGRYGEAADLFGQARALTTDDDHLAAHLAGWQARALLLCDRPDNRESAKRVMQEACALAPGCGQLRLRLETMP